MLCCCSKTRHAHPSEATCIEGANEHVHVSTQMQSGVRSCAGNVLAEGSQIQGIPVWWHGRASGIVVFEDMPWAVAVVPLSEAAVAARRGGDARPS
jgi:hypothetical protein